MLPTVIKSRPSQDDDFTPLDDYQQQTPDTFFEEEGHKPVLYFHDEHIKVWCSPEHASKLHIFSGDKLPSPPESHALENDGGKHLREEETVDVFVASHKLILYSRTSETGIEIPYPSITLHAVKNFKHLQNPDDETAKFTAVYMQLEFSGDGGDDDESFDPIELTLVPYSPDGTATRLTTSPRTSALFDQISACQNLHPDPADEDDDEEGDEMDRIVFEGEALDGLPGAFQGDSNGGLPPPMPGSSGWITADNVNEYFDEQGNWIGFGSELGEGAGRVRGHDEVDDTNDGTNGHEVGDDAESKRPRTE
ncbi:regulator of volume decrease after cellular swelling-domain-containing protein [Truncatella angustata]|uniref:Regulator of volume decrease after cellular swelling-domain-containing protein n=1 Tax=Truncatella angustata TaxID=152316 RepID=A0A9P8ZZT6_9PEZI|nr:regulator of volume decrease after cellular swelling-domain-containing protein [Truncatella angustata]KAH6655344.1 regulator of volume decrease after cellular swelling-domain-containing protein [Truncatella angustata]